MATRRQNYVSIFKIDGIPILPPLMTEEKRRQMQKYKETAIQLQHGRRKTQKLGRPSNSFEPSCNLLRHGHSHIPQPHTPRKQTVDGTPNSATPKRERFDKLRQTNTLVYDNRANSIILTLEGFEEETDFQSVEIERPQNLDQNDNKISPDVPKSAAKNLSNETPSKPQPYAAFIPIPSICVNPPTPCVTNNPICATTPPKRLCSSPTLKPDGESSMIRSNSFILDGPSSALLEHIKNQKLKKSTATQDTVESKAKRVQKVEVKPKQKTSCSTNLGHFVNNVVIFKTKRSPYESKTSSKKIARKHKFVKPVVSKKLPQSNGEVHTNLPSTPKSPSKLDVLKDIEEQHRARFLELVRQQQIEQKRLQEQFETQQNLLLDQLSARMAKVQTQSPPSTSTIDSAQSSPSASPEQQDPMTSNVNPRRRLFPDKSQSARESSPSSQSNTSASVRRLEELKQRRHWAATKINAFARGFLTRRLFRTDYVQRIIQTMKDTLIFVMNFHLETFESPSEEDVMLKVRLLEQLSAAGGNLHFVLFETTVKERMEIIARDRKYLKAKLLNAKRSPRIIR